MKKFTLIFLIVVCQVGLKAQFSDSLNMELGTSVTGASRNYLPLWLVANRFGSVSDRKFDASTYFKASTSARYGKSLYPEVDTIDRGYYVNVGVEIFNNNHFTNVTITEAYLRVEHRGIRLNMGRFKQIIGEVDPDLSSGSLGVSGNAVPVPKVSLSLNYTNIPFTKGFAQFKTQVSHGWMGENQYMADAFLHDKTFYIRLGKGKIKVYGGVQHYAVWGGRRGNLTLDRSIKGFSNVLLAREANDGSVFGNIAPNRAGDHRGVIEGGIEWENQERKIRVNHQTPFDMGQGIDIRNIDRLLSIDLISKRSDSWFKKILFEFIYTKQMNDFYSLNVRESYYNNGVYKTGWEYQNNIIGTPLFINRVRGQNYFDNVEPYDWSDESAVIPGLTNIINNRIIGAHFGLILNTKSRVIPKFLLTYTRNYGNNGSGDFGSGKDQVYMLNELTWKPKLIKDMYIFTSLAVDFGQLSDNIGCSFGLRWNLLKS